MKTNKLLVLAFFAVEYLPRTFIQAYKLREVGWFLEFVPIICCSVIMLLFFPPAMKCEGKAFFGLARFLFYSILGYVIAFVVGFFQWYINNPEYRSCWQDDFTLVFMFYSIGMVLIIMISTPIYFIVRLLSKKNHLKKQRVAQKHMRDDANMHMPVSPIKPK
jgi:hypothetical protein